MGLNWPAFECYPVFKKKQMEVYVNGPENNRIQQNSNTPAPVSLEVVLGTQKHL
jgi:hypothetical protein